MKANDLSLISWDCVHFLPGNPIQDLAVEFQGIGIGIFICDMQRIENEQELISAVANTLSFPDYFGFNWDAMDECLCDLGWLPEASGYVLAISNAKALWQTLPYPAGRLVQSWLFAAEQWSKEEKPFHLLFLEMEI